MIIKTAPYYLDIKFHVVLDYYDISTIYIYIHEITVVHDKNGAA